MHLHFKKDSIINRRKLRLTKSKSNQTCESSSRRIWRKKYFKCKTRPEQREVWVPGPRGGRFAIRTCGMHWWVVSWCFTCRSWRELMRDTSFLPIRQAHVHCLSGKSPDDIARLVYFSFKTHFRATKLHLIKRANFQVYRLMSFDRQYMGVTATPTKTQDILIAPKGPTRLFGNLANWP